MTPSEQTRADAFADAEQFERVTGYGQRAAYHGQWAAWQIEQGFHESGDTAATAARAAFRAVPGLREDK